MVELEIITLQCDDLEVYMEQRMTNSVKEGEREKQVVEGSLGVHRRIFRQREHQAQRQQRSGMNGGVGWPSKERRNRKCCWKGRLGPDWEGSTFLLIGFRERGRRRKT